MLNAFVIGILGAVCALVLFGSGALVGLQLGEAFERDVFVYDMIQAEPAEPHSEAPSFHA